MIALTANTIANADALYSSDQIQESLRVYPAIEMILDINKTPVESLFWQDEESNILPTLAQITVDHFCSQEWETATVWGGSIKERFDTLSLKDALGQATCEDLRELELLQRKRRALHHPRSIDEIERDIKNERALRKVIEGLSEYVRPL